MQKTRVQSLIQEDPTRRGATKPERAPQLLTLCSRVQEPQLLRPRVQLPKPPRPRDHALPQEKPRQQEAPTPQWRITPACCSWRKARVATKTQHGQRKEKDLFSLLAWMYKGKKSTVCLYKYVCVFSCTHAQSCSTLCDPMDCSPAGSSVHGILQARILEYVANFFFRGSSQPRDWTCTSGISCFIVVAQSLSHVQLFVTPWTAALGFPVLHYLPEFAYTHVRWVGDAIQSSPPLLSPSPPAFHLSQHQGLFKWVSSSRQVAKVWVSASASVLPMNIQDWFPLEWTGWISLQSKGLKSLLQHHNSVVYFGTIISLLSFSLFMKRAYL